MAFGDYASNGAGTDAGSTTSSSTTFPGSTTSGNSVLVWVRHGGTTGTCTVTDNKSNTYTEVTGSPVTQTTDGHRLRCYFAHNITGGASHQVTVTFSGAATMRYCIEEYTGDFAVHGTPPTAQGNDASPSSGTQVTTATCAITGGISNDNPGSNGVLTAGSGFTKRHDATAQDAVASLDKGTAQVAGSHQANGTYPLTRNWAAMLVAFSDAAAGGATPVARRRGLLGVGA